MGLSSNARSEDTPNPYRLLEQEPGLLDFVEYSAPLSLDEAARDASLWPTMLARRLQVPLLFHPVHLNLYGPALESKERLRALGEHLLAVGSAWVGNDVGWWHSGGAPFPGYLYLPPPLDAEGLEACVRHASHVQSALPVPLALENPAVMAARGGWHVLDFMAALHRRTGLPLLLDLGHLLSHQLARGLPLSDGLDRFPLDQVVELHLAGGVVTRREGRSLYFDDHTQPVREELFGLLEQVLPRCTRLRAVTFEGDGQANAVAAITLRRLRASVPTRAERRAVEVVGPPAPVASLTLDDAHRERAWSMLDEVHQGEGEGGEEELEARLAVLFEALDRRWPLSRWLCLGGDPAQREFARSPELREVYADGERNLDLAFAAYARRVAREHADEALVNVLALETWAQAAAARGRSPPPTEGELSLCAGVCLATFPLDLREAVYAARALRRHLSARGWASGRVELSGLEALRQAALRPVRRPWWLALRRREDRLELVDLEPPVVAVMRAVQDGREVERGEGLRSALQLGLIVRR